jgi:hypothetical protein
MFFITIVRYGIIFTDFLSIISCIILQIQSPQALFFGRLIQGLTVGLFSSFCPLFVK